MGARTEYKDFDVEHVLSQLTLEEKISLLSGHDAWHTAPIHRLGVPSVRFSDGPTGVRGTKFFQSTPAAALPCGTALAATWDTELIKEGGRLQAREAIGKGASLLLGPTTNMQRSPIGGRGFEAFSEDPVLAGAMSAATINGLQSVGVASTLKHYVCNDQEHQRQLVEAIVTERALREIYLMPFQIAERDAKPWAYMTAYNRVNGIHVSDNKRLLQDVLRDEWGYDGLVMSDWFGTYSTVEAIKAGTDLEMPGKTFLRGPLVEQAVRSGKLTTRDIDARARQVLKLVKRVLPLGIPENAPEEVLDTPETAALVRQLSSNSIVLLKNQNGILPFSKEKSLAVIGSNAAFTASCGGGSAVVAPYYTVSPLEGLRKQGADAQFALGAAAWKMLPLLSRMTTTKDGKKGLDLRIYLDPPTKEDRQQIDHLIVDESDALMVDYKHPEIKTDLFWAEFEGKFVPERTDSYDFGVTVAGTAKLYVNGKLVVDNETKQKAGGSFFGSGTGEEVGSIFLEQGQEYTILVQFGTLPTITFTVPGVTPCGCGGIRLGCHRTTDKETELREAVELAKSVDQVVICAGLNKDWEAEGFDRDTMDLPPGGDELIRAVVAANPNTAVVVQSGTPVTMPWVHEVPAIMQAWYGGNETGNAIADVVFGELNPGGKLPLTFPVRMEDNPAFLSTRSEAGRTLYGEDIYVGYRFYEKTKREVLFPFGHGLSYTTFEFKDVKVQDGDTVTVSVDVSNIGKTDGAAVVQIYISQEKPSINRPPKELKGFKKVVVKAGVTERVEIAMLKKYACSYWDESRDSWIMEQGKYEVLVGDSSASISLKSSFEVEQTTWWKGL